MKLKIAQEVVKLVTKTAVVNWLRIQKLKEKSFINETDLLVFNCITD